MSALSKVNKGLGILPGLAKLKSKGESTCAIAMTSMRSKALIRLCACRALVACALKRSTKL